MLALGWRLGQRCFSLVTAGPGGPADLSKETCGEASRSDSLCKPRLSDRLTLTLSSCPAYSLFQPLLIPAFRASAIGGFRICHLHFVSKSQIHISRKTSTYFPKHYLIGLTDNFFCSYLQNGIYISLLKYAEKTY